MKIRINQKRIIAIICLLLSLFSFLSLIIGELYMLNANNIRSFIPLDKRAYTSFSLVDKQKSSTLVDAMPNIPEDYQLIDWKEKSLGFQNVAFNDKLNDEQNFLPLFRVADINGKRIGVIPAFVAHKPINGSLPNAYPVASSEAVTLVNSVLSGSLIGLDMSDIYGEDYVSMCLQFINNEGVLTNWLGGASSSTSMWYMQYSTLQLFALADLYPAKTEIKKAVRIIADKYYEALLVLGGGTKSGIDMDIQSFDFARMRPVKQMSSQGTWKERDSAVTIGLMMYWSYRQWGDDKFLESSIWCADYMDKLTDNPQYEIAFVYCPYFMAMLNAEVGTNYDLSKQIEKILSTSSDARNGWGYTNVEMNTDNNPKLYGVCQSNNPYYWYMNTVEGAAAFIPLALYDQTYANLVGKYILNAVNSSRYFFSDGPIGDKKYAGSLKWESEYAKYVPYEAIHWMIDNGHTNIRNGVVPSNANLHLSGDPVIEKWDFMTDHSMYSGASTGKFGGTIYPTNVEGILQIDLTKLDFMRTSSTYQTYLYYNPYNEQKTIIINLGYKFYDLYDSVSDTFIKKSATGIAQFSVPAGKSVSLVLAPANSVRRQVNQNIYLNNAFVAQR